MRELINEVARETASMAYIDGMGGEVNYFRAMESLLFNYKKLSALVADYEAYTHVELQGRSASISSYSPSSGYTYRTEEDILEEMKRDKIISYHRTRARFEEIDRVVKLFAERKEFHVIRMYYFGEDAQGNERPGRRGAVHMGSHSRRAGRNGTDPRRKERAQMAKQNRE